MLAGHRGNAWGGNRRYYPFSEKHPRFPEKIRTCTFSAKLRQWRGGYQSFSPHFDGFNQQVSRLQSLFLKLRHLKDGETLYFPKLHDYLMSLKGKNFDLFYRYWNLFEDIGAVLMTLLIPFSVPLIEWNEWMRVWGSFIFTPVGLTHDCIQMMSVIWNAWIVCDYQI